MLRYRMNLNLNLTVFTDSYFAAFGEDALILSQYTDGTAYYFNSNHDFFTYEDIVIRMASGGGGTLLTKDTDYQCVDEITDLTTRVTAALGITKTVYNKIQSCEGDNKQQRDKQLFHILPLTESIHTNAREIKEKWEAA